MSAKPKGLLLHLGCGFGRLDGWVNCDLHPTPTADQVFDAQKRWPFEDGQVREIYASHLLEHLPDHETFFREAWRVLEPNGTMVLRVPYGGHRLAWSDPTHVKAWFGEGFCFLQPGYGRSVGNPQETDWDAPFCVHLVNLRVAAKWAWWLRNRFTRRLFLRYAENIENAIEEIWVFLYALKSEDAIAEFRKTHAPNAICARFALYQHHFEGREEMRPDENASLKVFDLEYTAKYGFESTPT